MLIQISACIKQHMYTFRMTNCWSKYNTSLWEKHRWDERKRSIWWFVPEVNFTPDRYTSVLQLFNMSILKGNGDNATLFHMTLCSFASVEKTRSRRIYPGQQVEVSVVAIDQLGSAIPTLIHITVLSGKKKWLYQKPFQLWDIRKLYQQKLLGVIRFIKTKNGSP